MKFLANLLLITFLLSCSDSLQNRVKNNSNDYLKKGDCYYIKTIDGNYITKDYNQDRYIFSKKSSKDFKRMVFSIRSANKESKSISLGYYATKDGRRSY